ncbi:MAG TPA: dihydroorotate dehydrogenase, partial [Clostridiales bacterium]|nr:dihydroorotate dehydrogenase [Clostridiales bacterium]
MVDLRTTVGSLQLANPVLAASGTFGFGREMSQYHDLSQLGGICSKGLTLLPCAGNAPPRVAETASGM